MTWDPCGCDMTHKATWQRHANPHADVARARGKATRVHADTQVAPTWQCEGLAGDGPTGIVGLS